MTVTIYCEECTHLVHLGHVPTTRTDDGLAFNLVPALRAHAAQHA